MKTFMIILSTTIIFSCIFIKMYQYEESRPPYWTEVCDEGYYMPIKVGNSTVMNWICTASHKECVIGSKYDGPIKQCK